MPTYTSTGIYNDTHKRKIELPDKSIVGLMAFAKYLGLSRNAVVKRLQKYQDGIKTYDEIIEKKDQMRRPKRTTASKQADIPFEQYRVKRKTESPEFQRELKMRDDEYMRALRGHFGNTRC